MELIRRGKNFSLQRFIAPALDLMPCLQACSMMDCKKGIKFKKEAINCCYEKRNFFHEGFFLGLIYGNLIFLEN